jgi:hypothetical protein
MLSDLKMKRQAVVLTFLLDKRGIDNRIRYAYLPAYRNNEAVEGLITTKGLSILD